MLSYKDVFESVYKKNLEEAKPESKISVVERVKDDKMGLGQLMSRISYMEYQKAIQKNKKTKPEPPKPIHADELEASLKRIEDKKTAKRAWTRLRVMEKKEKIKEYLETFGAERHGITEIQDSFLSSLIDKGTREMYKFVYDSETSKLTDIVGLSLV